MKLSISEILKLTAQIPSRDRVMFLQRHDSPALRQTLILALHPQLKWLLPPGAPDYTKANLVGTQGILYTEARKYYLFLEGCPKQLTDNKRQQLFINLLEAIHPADAELILAIKDGKWPYPEIDIALANQAFPGLINV